MRVRNLLAAALIAVAGAIAVPANAETGPQSFTTTTGSGTTKSANVDGIGLWDVDFGYVRKDDNPSRIMIAVSVYCNDGVGYSGTFNIESGVVTNKQIPFSGTGCRLIVSSRQADNWTPSVATIKVKGATLQPVEEEPYNLRAEWTSNATKKDQTFSFGKQDGFKGWLTIKGTACSSDGGTTDRTKKKACTGQVEKGVGSVVELTVKDDSGVIEKRKFDVNAKLHHDVTTFNIDRPVRGELKVDVRHLKGSSMIIHGPGSSIVGYKVEGADPAPADPVEEVKPGPEPIDGPNNPSEEPTKTVKGPTKPVEKPSETVEGPSEAITEPVIRPGLPPSGN